MSIDILVSISDASSLIFVAMLVEWITNLILKPGQGAVHSSFGGFLGKRKSFLIFLILIYLTSIFNPTSIVSSISSFIQKPENGGPYFKLLIFVVIFWVYFNKKAGWNPLKLGG